ncbi:SigE family RNA polymerase sigma factor [Streptomyces sp. XM4193]|uniref:SigE family RNA polymerase sigma factor n=1 Tax=Streptomyces sp. XM4193 TaxID=2929782 RepID=UPI001FFA79C9|nr:SigE family RNA polymerase sigma factor [Streptomyces sp. XM4193]MCK1795630.1 SigE family RNA polymerase sigma factor [Streptomyces sp. XM4193]
MNTLHGSKVGAVAHTRRYTVSVPTVAVPSTRSTEKSSAKGVRGCARGTGRQRPSHIASLPGGNPGLPGGVGEQGNPGAQGNTGEHGGTALRGERQGEGVSREGTGERHTGVSEAEFVAYVSERRASLYATAYHLTGDRFEAEDLLQSALFSTYRAWDRISDKAAVGGYLRRTMTNLHISAWRRRKLNEYPTEELPEPAVTGQSDAMRGTELRTVLWQALARLPELQRTMLVLRYYEGRTDPEIADILDISVGTVKSGIWRSLRRLRDDQVLALGRDQEECFGELVA